MKPWYRNSTLQMEDAEMEWLQKKDPASCAVWEWLKGDCQKRDTNKLRELSVEELATVSCRLGIDSPRFSQILQSLQKLRWTENGSVRSWDVWQRNRSNEEDKWRKQAEYWKAKAQRVTGKHARDPDILPVFSQNLPNLPSEERRGEEKRVRTDGENSAFVPEVQTADRNGSPLETINRLQTGLNSLYKRRSDQAPGYEEQRLLLEISSRAEAEDEWKEILNFHAALDDQTFFPNSLKSLLEKWQSTLDRARSYSPRKKSLSDLRTQAQALEKEIERNPARPDSNCGRRPTQKEIEEYKALRIKLKLVQRLITQTVVPE